MTLLSPMNGAKYPSTVVEPLIDIQHEGTILAEVNMLEPFTES